MIAVRQVAPMIWGLVGFAVVAAATWWDPHMDTLLALLGASVAVVAQVVRRTPRQPAIEWLSRSSAGSLGP